MIDLLFRGLVLRVIVMFCVGVTMATLALILTPAILLAAAFAARRDRLSFRFALADMYSSIWGVFWQIIRTQFSRGI